MNTNQTMDLNFAKSMKVMPKMVSSDLPDTYQLSEGERAFYKDNGYLVIGGLIDFASLYSYKQRAQQVMKGLVPADNLTVVKEPALKARGAQGEDLINKIQDIVFDEVFGQYFEHPRLLHVVSQLICGDIGDGEQFGDNIMAMHSMFLNKPPGTSPHPPHQDLHYFPFRPASRIVASWTAVDHVTRANGSLWVVPGSHRQGAVYPHTELKDANKFYHGIADPAVAPDSARVHLPMAPGDTVFFHSLLVHGSGPNHSQNYRKSISGHFANSECRYVPLEGAQHLIADKLEEIGRKRGYKLTYTEYWQYRAKLVKGVRCNL